MNIFLRIVTINSVIFGSTLAMANEAVADIHSSHHNNSDTTQVIENNSRDTNDNGMMNGNGVMMSSHNCHQNMRKDQDITDG
jgi:hypothetical protein